MDYQPTADLASICPEPEVKDHPTSLVVNCGQHVKSSSRCWLSRRGIQLSVATRISHDAGMEPIHSAGDRI